MIKIKLNLRDVRKSKNITQIELSDKTGIVQQNLSLYERGEKIPQIDTAAKIAAALGVTLDELITIKVAKESVAKKLKKLLEDKSDE